MLHDDRAAAIRNYGDAERFSMCLLSLDWIIHVEVGSKYRPHPEVEVANTLVCGAIKVQHVVGGVICHGEGNVY